MKTFIIIKILAKQHGKMKKYYIKKMRCYYATYNGRYR